MSDNKSFRDKTADNRDQILNFFGTTTGLVFTVVIAVAIVGFIVFSIFEGLIS